MAPANDNKMSFRSLDNLPMFATDKEIALAVVGTKRAADWLRASFPKISAQRGFPQVDAMHGGRATVKVAKFYETYIGATGPGINAAQDGGDKVGTWNRSSRRA
jgi:hypothetical protein